MVEYLSGNRIQGSSTLSTVPPQTSWKLLARGVYDASDPDTLDSGTFTAKDNLMIIGNKLPNGNSDLTWRINGQTTGYAWRFSNNGASDVAYGSRTNMLGDSGGSTNLSFQVGTMSNTLNKEKQMICNSIEASTAGNTSPTRRESVNKSIYQPQITSVVGTNGESGSFATGSEILVLGCDNDEADSGTNFWQELASVTLSSVGDDLDTGTFTAKKYLKIEFYSDGDGSGNSEVFPVIAFNNDTTQANYAVRRSNNFATDSTFDNSHGGYGLYLGWGGGDDPEQCTAYISNNSGYEKLYMGEMNIRGNVNAIGDYNQHCGKWKTTSGQINRINIRNGGGSQFSTNSYLKVWGAD